MAFNTVAIAGLGLVGGSVALALRQAAPNTRILGFDLPARLSLLQNAHVADEVDAVEHLPERAGDADLVFVAVPAEHVAEVVGALSGRVKDRAIVTDVAGVKSAICEAGGRALGPKIFIGGHPMAGAEGQGVRRADPLLFRGRPWLLCPLAGVNPESLLDLMALVEKFGAKPMTLDPPDHDRLVALVSHLPQLVATTLMAVVERAGPDRENALKIAGPAFREITRVAASDYSQWEGILRLNRAPISKALDELEAALSELRKRLADDDLAPMWREASGRRRKMVDQGFRPATRAPRGE
ncbi:prephenate dehydrogenase/arogenate dehydrogenase family protein [bacterium]|nr:prephenate dehydrogenase/arogenate dehydrogenase family protein [bacterium]